MGIDLANEICFLGYLMYLLIPQKTYGYKCCSLYGKEHRVSTGRDLRSALEMMELSAGLTCQQKSAGLQMKHGKEITAAAPVPSLLLAASPREETSFSYLRLPCLSAPSPQLPLTHTSRTASRPLALKGHVAFWNPVL